MFDNILRYKGFYSSSESEKEKEIECNPCSNENVQVKATNFCKTCADPEPFCGTCARQHTRQKIFRDHQLCGEIRDFFQHLENIG